MSRYTAWKDRKIDRLRWHMEADNAEKQER